MRRITCYATLMVFVGSSFLAAQETVQPRKQRVSPKLLREAMALPEYRAQSADSKPAFQLEDVSKLAEKLKKNGDTEGASLLQQFITAHQQLMKQAGIQSTPANDTVGIELQIVESRESEIPESSVLRERSMMMDISNRKQTELKRLLTAGKATMLVAPSTFAVTPNQAIRLTATNRETSTQIEDRNSTALALPSEGIAIEVLASISKTLNFNIQLTCEIQRAPKVLSSTTKPENSQKIAAQVNLNDGDTLVMQIPSEKPEHLNFVVLTPSRKN